MNTVVAARPAKQIVRRFADGTFVRSGDFVWRVVGGAAFRIYRWSIYSHTYATVTLTKAELQHYVWFPVHPRDGTVVRSLPDKRVYIFAGGAPLPVTSWAAVGGVRPRWDVDAEAFVRDAYINVDAGIWTAIAPRPTDGTVLRTGDGATWIVVGGAPVYLSTWAAFDGRVLPKVQVDLAVVDHACDAPKAVYSIWRWLGCRPSYATACTIACSPDYRFVVGGQTGKLYKVQRGYVLYQSTLSPFDPNAPSSGVTVIDQTAIDRAGELGRWIHLLPQPM